VVYNTDDHHERIEMVRRPQAATFLIAVACFIIGNVYSPESAANTTAASDGMEYVYVSLDSDTQSYQVGPKNADEWKVISSDDKDKNAKADADMLSYKVMPKKDGPDDRLPYYQSIREKILARLKRNYTNHYNDGDVNLFFILNKAGSIVRIDVALNRSTKDAKLIDTALLSLQQAAPFGPFPKDLKAQQVLFSLVISFKKDNR